MLFQWGQENGTKLVMVQAFRTAECFLMPGGGLHMYGHLTKLSNWFGVRLSLDPSFQRNLYISCLFPSQWHVHSQIMLSVGVRGFGAATF